MQADPVLSLSDQDRPLSRTKIVRAGTRVLWAIRCPKSSDVCENACNRYKLPAWSSQVDLSSSLRQEEEEERREAPHGPKPRHLGRGASGSCSGELLVRADAANHQTQAVHHEVAEEADHSSSRSFLGSCDIALGGHDAGDDEQNSDDGDEAGEDKA